MISCAAWVQRDVIQSQAGKKPARGLQVDEALMNLDLGEEDSWEEVPDDEDEQLEEDSSEENVDMAETSGKSSAGKRGKKKKKEEAGDRKSDVAMKGVESDLAELNMDGYDDEDDEKAFVTSVYGGKRPGGAFYRSNKEDPHMNDDEVSTDSEEEDDMVLKRSDHMILAAKNEEDLSQLEVWVYEDLGSEGNLYVHHDIILPAFALSVASGDFDPRDMSSSKKPMCAIGTFDPEIEIWDLTTVDSLQPAAVLGGYEEDDLLGDDGGEGAMEEEEEEQKSKKSKKKKKKKKKKKMPKRKTLKEGSHEDSVLSLAWNWEFRNVLASGSADTTLKIWDLEKLQCVNALTHHTDKVQSICWNHTEAQVILSGGFDQKIHLSDMRASASLPVKWQLKTDVEGMIWDISNPTSFLVSCEDGSVSKYDTRLGSDAKPLWMIKAHDKACCDLSLCGNPAAKGLLATGSLDKSVKLWDTSSDENDPKLVLSKKLKTGPVFTTTFSPEASAPPYLAVGGTKGELLVWDIRSEEEIVKKYPQLVK